MTIGFGDFWCCIVVVSVAVGGRRISFSLCHMGKLADLKFGKFVDWRTPALKAAIVAFNLNAGFAGVRTLS
jgi:hypothetical protein